MHTAAHFNIRYQRWCFIPLIFNGADDFAATGGADTFKSTRHLMDGGHGAITKKKIYKSLFFFFFFFFFFSLHKK